MKALFGVGLVVLILGLLSFFVPVPHRENHELKAGDLHVGVQTQHNTHVQPAVSVVLVVVGAVMMVGGKGRD